MNMAITMNGLKGLAGRMTEKVTGRTGTEHTTLIMQTVRKLADTEPGKAPLIGHLPVEKQYLYTGGTLIVSLLLAAGFTIYSLVQLDNRAGYESHAGELKVLSQRLPLAAQQSVLGNKGAFNKLNEGKLAFETTLAGLADGDEGVPATKGAARDSLDKVKMAEVNAEKKFDKYGAFWKPLVGAGSYYREEIMAIFQELHRGIADGLEKGDFVIASGAVRADGTTKSYTWPEFPALASHEVVLALVDSAVRFGHKFDVGVCFSVDGFYSENKVLNNGKVAPMSQSNYMPSFMVDRLADVKAMGVKNIEMENGTVFTLTTLMGLRAGAICTVSDVVPWHPTEKIVDFEGNMLDCIDVAVEAMRTLMSWDKGKKGKFFAPSQL